MIALTLTFVLSTSATSACAAGIEDVLKTGKLRHLSIPYANFVSNQGEGLDVQLMKLFAAHLDIEYEFVESSWHTIIPDLTGKTIRKHGEEVELTGSHPVRGDVIATRFTILPWREKIVDL